MRTLFGEVALVNVGIREILHSSVHYFLVMCDYEKAVVIPSVCIRELLNLGPKRKKEKCGRFCRVEVGLEVGGMGVCVQPLQQACVLAASSTE